MYGLTLSYSFMLLSVTTIEFVDTSASLYLLLLAGIEGMALGANVKFKNVAFLGATSNESRATSANCRNFVIIGMYIFLHFYISSKLLALTIILFSKSFVNRFQAFLYF